MLLHGVKWGCASGPLQATIATLGQLGWALVAPNRLLTADRQTMEDLDDAAPNAATQIADAVEESAAGAVWRAAASHYLGSGLEEGEPSLCPASDARRKLISSRKPAHAKALDAVVCGGLWHSGRSQMVRHCRCGAVNDAFHHDWGCELLERVGEEEGYEVIAQTQWMASEWGGELRRYECLWGRAIVPKSLCDPGPQRAPSEVRRFLCSRFLGSRRL